MLKKNIKYNNIVSDLSSYINQAAHCQKQSFYFPITKFSCNLVKKLANEQIIWNVEKIAQKGLKPHYKIFVKSSGIFYNTQSKTHYKALQNCYLPGRLETLSLYKLKSYKNKNPTKLLYLTTSKGILNINEALRNNVGGIKLYEVTL